jgi:hypothetical protein
LPLPDPGAVADGVVGIGHNPFVFLQSGKDLGRQAGPLTDLHGTPARLSLLFDKNGPFLSGTEKGAGRDLKDIPAFPDDEVRLQAITIPEETPHFRR